MTFIEKFNQIKRKYGKIDESKLTEHFAVQVEMTDEDCGGIFYIAYMNGPFAIEPYDYYDNTAIVRVSSKVLENILSCKADPMESFFAGAIQVEGDISHALMLVDLMKKEPKPRKPRKAKTEEKAVVAEVKEEKKPAKEKAPKKEKAEKKPAVRKTAKKTTKKDAE
ncbi:MAG: SCP2 sterol-binding domain-containing protein [Clostridia bacterium]|nr:SCP2 sterol-binding domain-containing protein [Clostridia bacterium]